MRSATLQIDATCRHAVRAEEHEAVADEDYEDWQDELQEYDAHNELPFARLPEGDHLQMRALLFNAVVELLLAVVAALRRLLRDEVCGREGEHEDDADERADDEHCCALRAQRAPPERHVDHHHTLDRQARDEPGAQRARHHLQVAPEFALQRREARQKVERLERLVRLRVARGRIPRGRHSHRLRAPRIHVNRLSDGRRIAEFADECAQVGGVEVLLERAVSEQAAGLIDGVHQEHNVVEEREAREIVRVGLVAQPPRRAYRQEHECVARNAEQHEHEDGHYSHLLREQLAGQHFCRKTEKDRCTTSTFEYKCKAVRTANVDCGWHVFLERQLVINSSGAVRARVATSIHMGDGGVKRSQIN